MANSLSYVIFSWIGLMGKNNRVCIEVVFLSSAKRLRKKRESLSSKTARINSYSLLFTCLIN